ncbi:MAG: transglutaminase domain-containing protein [Planctomycetota bacterium]|jgi:transglutaminase-like putative cysteine protease|nr:transglutaminase domain-containing protein [Planctomycetota bacterium]
MRRMVAAILIALLGLACREIARAGEHPWENKRIYYVIENGGRLVEKGYFVRHAGSYQKIPCWIVDEEKSFFAPGDAAKPIRFVRTRTLTTMDGLALQRVEPALVVGDDSQEAIARTGGEAVFDTRGAYGLPGVVPVTDDVLFEISGEWLASHMTGTGASSRTANVLDRVTRGVVATQVLFPAQRAGSPGDPSAALRAEITMPGRPPVQARYTRDGRLLRLEGSGIVYQVVGREAYESGRIPGAAAPVPPVAPSIASGPDAGRAEAFVADDGVRDGQPAREGALRTGAGAASIPVGESVPAWDGFAWLLLSAEPGYDWIGAVTESEYARIEAAGPSVTITALRNAPFIDSSVNFPMEVPSEIRPLLAATDEIPSSHQAVIEAAYVAVMDAVTKREEHNVLKAVSYLAGWLNQYVAVEEWSGYGSSALDTLARRSGDSLGHARLFSAMARTLGVPTRLCQGFLATTGRAVNHCWAEAWINGKWIPVDTTVSRVGLPAGYVLAEREEGGGAFRFDFAGFMRGPELRLRLITAGRETPRGGAAELVAGDRRTYAVSEGDWMANLYWGFALRLPPSWTGQARLNSVELTSPDGQASVRCEALEGDFRAGEAELGSTVASLRTNLSQFREIESRVVSFDGDGATPALFVDFTCVRDGEQLRCRQYVVPRRQRALRISFWAPSGEFAEYTSVFDRIVASFEF